MEATQRMGSGGVRGFLRTYRLAAFGVLVVAFTIAVAAARLPREAAPFALIFVPAIAALIVSALVDGRTGVAELFRRITRWRVRPIWYVAAIGIPFVMWMGIALGGFLLGAPATGLFQNLGELPLVMLVVLIPAFIEEFGWRGFAVPAAPRSWPLAVTGLVVGVLFLVPHLALYMPGQLYDHLPLWPLVLIILSGSILYTWGFAASGGSALIAALMHASSNGLTPLSRGIDPLVVWQLQGIVIALIALALVVLSRRLRRRVDAPAIGAPRQTATAQSPAI